MFSTLFGCFAKGKSSKLVEIDEHISGPLPVNQSTLAPENEPKAEEVRTGVFRRIFTRSRRSKDKEILGYEKRYLKKFLSHQNLYVSGMTLPEMRRAKRLLLEPEKRKNFCLHCCHCFDCYCREDLKDATDNKNVKQVAFAEMVPTTKESKASEEGECSDVTTATMAKTELESNENQNAPAKKKVDAGNDSAPKASLEAEETVKLADGIDGTERPTVKDITPKDDLETSVKEVKAIREVEETAKLADGIDATECPTVTDITPKDDLGTSVKEVKAIREVEETAKLADDFDATECPTITDITPKEDLETSVKVKIPPEELAVEKENECIIPTKPTVDSDNPEAGRTPCEPQSSEAQQSTQSSECEESKEKVQSLSVEESLTDTNESVFATAEDLQKQTTKDANVEEKPTAMFNDKLVMVEVDGEEKMSEGECSSLDKTTKNENITVQSSESPLKQSTEESVECSVQEKDEAANGTIQAQPVEVILDKTGKMTPAEIERNNALHATVLKWFESQEEILSFIGGSDDTVTYASLAQPEFQAED